MESNSTTYDSKYMVFTNAHILNIIILHLNCKPMKSRCVGKNLNGLRCKKKPSKDNELLCETHYRKFINDHFDFNIFYRSKNM